MYKIQHSSGTKGIDVRMNQISDERSCYQDHDRDPRRNSDVSSQDEDLTTPWSKLGHEI